MTGATQGQPTIEDRSSEFVAVEGAQETSSAANLLVSAYILMWFAVFAMMWMSMKRLEKLSARLETLEDTLKKADQATNRAV